MPAPSIHCISCRRLLGWMTLNEARKQYPNGCTGCSQPVGTLVNCASVLDSLGDCHDDAKTFFCDDVGKPLK